MKKIEIWIEYEFCKGIHFKAISFVVSAAGNSLQPRGNFYDMDYEKSLKIFSF